MPYTITLRSYVLPEFEAQAPAPWEQRLRAISPVSANTEHLIFRLFAARPDWATSPFNERPDAPMWALYTARPIRLVEPLTAAGFEKHWSEYLSKEDESQGRMTGEAAAHKALVSDYQHFLWHSQGLYVKPFWLLQGAWGGTPMKYTKRETRYLAAAGQSSVPAPPGQFTPIPFDERAVKLILERDRFVQAGNRFDALEAMDRPLAKKAEDDAAEAVYREEVLKHLAALAAPAVAFMQSQHGKAEVADAVQRGQMRAAPAELPDTLAVWKDHFREHGTLPTVGLAATRKRIHAVS